MNIRDDMTFPSEEYVQRLNEIRNRMAQRQLDVVVISDPENIMYLTDYQTSGYSFFQALVIPLEKEPYMVMRKLEESNVPYRTWVEITRPYLDTGNAIQTLVDSLTEFNLISGRIGYERNSYFFPAYQQDRFRAMFNAELQAGRLVDCFGIVEESRAIKSKFEIEVMRHAAVAAKAGMAAGLAACQAGVTENEIAGEISAAMFKAGGEMPAVMPYVVSGIRSMIGHATWEGRTVQPNEHVFIEVGGCYRRYHTAIQRTAICGEMTDAMYQGQEIMKKALNTLHSELRPGLTFSEVNHMVSSIINDNTIGAHLMTRAGYSIGIAFPPSWDEGYIISVMDGDYRILQEGMTFHMIPWMWGIEGDKTCGISDTFYITQDGCDSFFKDVPQDFTIKP